MSRRPPGFEKAGGVSEPSDPSSVDWVVSESLVKKVAMLKRNCFASVFEKYFDYQASGSGGEEHAVINYREGETL